MPQSVVRKQGEVLLDIIGEAHALDESELPAALGRPLDAGQRETLKKLKQTASALAAEWQVEPEVLLPAKDYELMVRLAAGEPLERPGRWSGWRRERLIRPLLDVAGAEFD